MGRMLLRAVIVLSGTVQNGSRFRDGGQCLLGQMWEEPLACIGRSEGVQWTVPNAVDRTCEKEKAVKKNRTKNPQYPSPRDRFVVKVYELVIAPSRPRKLDLHAPPSEFGLVARRWGKRQIKANVPNEWLSHGKSGKVSVVERSCTLKFEWPTWRGQRGALLVCRFRQTRRPPVCSCCGSSVLESHVCEGCVSRGGEAVTVCVGSGGAFVLRSSQSHRDPAQQQLMDGVE